MPDVFVSYKAEDRARVSPLVDALEAAGHSVWWDARIGGGEDWRDEIAGHLDAARCVIVVWSKRSIGKDGRFVRDEATRALRRGTYLPIGIDKVDPPLGFGETQVLPLLGWKGSRNNPQFVAIEDAVRAMLGMERVTRTGAGVRRRSVVTGGAAAAAMAAAGATGWWLLKPGSAESNSIAVLPFANLSGDPAQNYFSDGMAEELRSALSRIAGLQVVARTSSEMLRDSDARTAASKLGVQHILTGSVRRSPSTIRVSAQLVDGKEGIERWSQSFDRPAGDVLTIQSEIANSVADALSIRLASADRAALRLGGTTNVAAHDLVLRSDHIRRDDSEASFRSALSLLDQAVALDPNYAEAYARKAFVLTRLAYTHALSSEQAKREGELANQSARRAIAIAPQFGMGHGALSNVLRNQLQMGAALRESETAIRLRDKEPLSLRNHTYLLMQSGRLDEAQAVALQVIESDPLNPVSYEVQTVTLYNSRHYQEAVAVGRKGLQMAPDLLRLRAFVGHALVQLGRADAAAREYALLPMGDYRRLLGEAVIAARAGRTAAAHRARERMQQRYGDSSHFQYGQIYAQLGLPDQAFTALEAAWRFRDAGFGYLKVDPFMDPLRKDPRFAALEARLNFPRH